MEFEDCATEIEKLKYLVAMYIHGSDTSSKEEAELVRKCYLWEAATRIDQKHLWCEAYPNCDLYKGGCIFNE